MNAPPTLPNGKEFTVVKRTTDAPTHDVFLWSVDGQRYRFALEWESPDIIIKGKTVPFVRRPMPLCLNDRPFAPSPEKMALGKERKQAATLGMDTDDRLAWFIAKPWRVNSHNYRERKIAKRDRRAAILLRLIDGALVEEIVEPTTAGV